MLRAYLTKGNLTWAVYAYFIHGPHCANQAKILQIAYGFHTLP